MTGRRSPPGAFPIALVALVVGLGFQGSRGLYETTEGRYAEVGREMLDAGSWLTPTLDHLPHWSKPPLTYWAIAGGIALLGRNPWGVRLFNALALPLAALGVALLGGALWGREEGRLAGLVYATSLFPVVAASTVSTDLLLAAWEVWAVALYWAAVRASDPPEGRRYVAGFWAALGLAFLTKGPPALLSLLAVLAYGFLARRRGWPRASLWSARGFALFAALGLSWYAWAVLTTPGLLGYFLGEEVVARVASDRFGRNPEWWKPALVYGAPLLLGLGAWLAWRPRRVAAALRRERRAPELAFLALWLALPIVVLSVSRSRLPLYVLPFFPALVLAFARGQAVLARGADAPPAGRWPAWRRAALAGGLLLTLKAASAHVPSPKDMAPLARAVTRLAPGRVVLVDHDALYGLQFYLDAPVARLGRGAASRGTTPSAGAPSPGRAEVRGVLYVARHADAMEAALAPLPGACARLPVSLREDLVAVRVEAPPGAPPCLPRDP